MKLELWNNKISKSRLPVVVEFWAKWCGPCKMMAPSLETVRKEYSGKVELIKVDADTDPELLRSLKVYSIPTMIVYNHGKLVTRKSGAASVGQLRQLFDMAIEGQRKKAGMNTAVRTLILVAGTGLIAAGFMAGNSIPLFILGGAVIFSAVYDRCPIWQFISTRIANALHVHGPKAE